MVRPLIGLPLACRKIAALRWGMESGIDFWTAKALLDWQVEMGADEAIGDTPVDRYALDDKKPVTSADVKPDGIKPAPPPVVPAPGAVDKTAAARAAAQAAQNLGELRAAMAAFDLCPLKAGAHNLLFSDGVPGSPVMILTDAPDREDDRAGKMFAGPSGTLLDKLLAAIGLGRSGEAPVYLAPVVPWNPPQNGLPSDDDMAMLMPFLQRHIILAAPKILVLMGNSPCQALLGKTGMTRLRGDWTQAMDLPALPMFAPSYLLGNPSAKREAWADLLSLKSRLKGLS